MTFHACADTPPLGGLIQIFACAMGWGYRRNQLCEIFWISVAGFIALTTVLRYRAYCDYEWLAL